MQAISLWTVSFSNYYNGNHVGFVMSNKAASSLLSPHGGIILLCMFSLWRELAKNRPGYLCINSLNDLTKGIL